MAIMQLTRAGRCIFFCVGDPSLQRFGPGGLLNLPRIVQCSVAQSIPGILEELATQQTAHTLSTVPRRLQKSFGTVAAVIDTCRDFRRESRMGCTCKPERQPPCSISTHCKRGRVYTRCTTADLLAAITAVPDVRACSFESCTRCVVKESCLQQP